MVVMVAPLVRKAEIARVTKETDIQVDLTLDGTGQSAISTEIGFLDHMLESFAKHGAFDLKVAARGDLHIDFHHTVEDTGIVVGAAFKKALGDMKGIRRFGHAYIPMDEALSRVSVDFCNRPYLVWKVSFPTAKLGDFDTELFKEWFHAFAMNSGACVHVENLYGANSHHIAESCFKALARASRTATEPDGRLQGVVSTKGTL
jgi:imidazoleglycerol-phosphate dehydratase